MKKRTVLKIMLRVLLAVAVFAGCAHMGNGENAVQEQLIRRVETYWNAKISDQIEVAYAIEHPEGRKKVPLLRYARASFFPQQEKMRVLEYKILTVDIKNDQAKVLLQQKVRITAPALITVVQFANDEQWFRVDGEWYRNYKDPKELTENLLKPILERREPDMQFRSK